MVETIAYNVIVYVAKATTQPATETDILKCTCDFIIYKLQTGKQSHCGGLETSVLIPPHYFLKNRQCDIIGKHTHKEAQAGSFIPIHLLNKHLPTE
jgi:hypothetical protein